MLFIMSTAARYQPRYTVDDYRQWQGRWELWAGVAVAISPSPTGRHAELLGRLIMAFGNAVEAGSCSATVLVEIDWIVSRDTVVRPDMTIVCGGPPERHVERAPALVVEVLSEATRERDLVFKRALYEEQRVPWYVIADPEERTLKVLSLATNGCYDVETLAAASGQRTLVLCDNCEITFDPARFFP
jgi:Uma2 family endonuclease